MNCKKESINNKQLSFYFVFFLCSIVLNSYLNGSLLNIIVAGISLVVIIFLIAGHSSNHALLVLFIAIISSISIPESQLSAPGEEQQALYNFLKLKIFGPISLSTAVMLFVVLLFIHKNNWKVSVRNNKVFFIFLVFFLWGNITALVTMILNSNFSFSSFIYYNIYFFHAGLYFFIAYFIYSVYSIHSIKALIRILTLSMPVIVYIMFIFGVSYEYSGIPIPIGFELLYFLPIILFSKHFGYKQQLFFFDFIALTFYLFIIFSGALGGKGIMLMIVAFAFRALVINYAVSVALLVVFSVFFVYYDNIILFLYEFEFLKLFVYKLESLFILVFNLFESSNYYLIPESPRVRLYEFILIDFKYTNSLFISLLGTGFGSCFTDPFGYLHDVNMLNAYPVEEIKSGCFSRAHDAIPAIFNIYGYLGLLFLIFWLLIFIPLSRQHTGNISFMVLFLGPFLYNHVFLMSFFIFALIHKFDRRVLN